MARLSKTRKAEVRQVLVEARKLLARPKGWVKGQYHTIVTNRYGEDVAAHCAFGAVGTASRDYGFDVRLDAVRVLGKGLPDGIVAFNDEKKTRKKDVLALFDAAIERVTV